MWKLQVDWPNFSVPPSYRSVPEGNLPHGATVNLFYSVGKYTVHMQQIAEHASCDAPSTK